MLVGIVVTGVLVDAVGVQVSMAALGATVVVVALALRRASARTAVAPPVAVATAA